MPANCRVDRHSIVLFDGACNLCHATVGWVLRHDRQGLFRFASLQSDAARRALAAAGAPSELPEGMVVLDEAGVHIRSDAAIRIVSRLGFPWNVAAVSRVLPRRLRDAVYQWVADNRYRWFGRREVCAVPAADVAGRFLDADETGRDADR